MGSAVFLSSAVGLEVLIMKLRSCLECFLNAPSQLCVLTDSLVIALDLVLLAGGAGARALRYCPVSPSCTSVEPRQEPQARRASGPFLPVSHCWVFSAFQQTPRVCQAEPGGECRCHRADHTGQVFGDPLRHVAPGRKGRHVLFSSWVLRSGQLRLMPSMN